MNTINALEAGTITSTAAAAAGEAEGDAADDAAPTASAADARDSGSGAAPGGPPSSCSPSARDSSLPGVAGTAACSSGDGSAQPLRRLYLVSTYVIGKERILRAVSLLNG